MKSILLLFLSLSFFGLQAQVIDSISPDNNNPILGTISPTIIPMQIYGSNTYFTSSFISFDFLQGSYLLPLASASALDNNNASGILQLQQGTNLAPSGFYDLRHTFVQGTTMEIVWTDAFFINYNLSGNFTISGTIVQGTPKMDAAGDPMVYAKIFLENTAGDVLKVGRTDANGFISFRELTAGSYFLHIANHENNDPMKIDVGTSLNSTDLNIEFRSGQLVNSLKDDLFTEKFNLKIFPTLFNEKINLNYNLPTAQTSRISFYDHSGKLVFEKVLKDKKGEVNLLLIDEIQILAKGVYFLDLQIGLEKKSFKLVKN